MYVYIYIYIYIFVYSRLRHSINISSIYMGLHIHRCMQACVIVNKSFTTDFLRLHLLLLTTVPVTLKFRTFPSNANSQYGVYIKVTVQLFHTTHSLSRCLSRWTMFIYTNWQINSLANSLCFDTGRRIQDIIPLGQTPLRT